MSAKDFNLVNIGYKHPYDKYQNYAKDYLELRLEPWLKSLQVEEFKYRNSQHNSWVRVFIVSYFVNRVIIIII